MRDITLGDTIDFKFTTVVPSTDVPTTLSGSPVISAYVGNSTTQITAGITLSVDFDSVTGLNNVRVVASGGNGFADATDVSLVITTGTVGSDSAVGYKVAEFTIGRAAANAIIADVKTMSGQKTTIATLSSQTSFTLTAGSANNDAYKGWAAMVINQSTATQVALGVVSAYTGSSKTITLREDPAIFTMAAGNYIVLLPAKLTDGVNVTQIEGVDATDQLDAHAAAGLDAAGVRAAIGLASANLDTQLADKTGYSLTSAYNFAKGTTAMTESYAANGAAPTPVQAMFAMHQMLMQFSIASTSYTVKKLDNSTTAFVVTLNDATSPTSAVRT